MKYPKHLREQLKADVATLAAYLAELYDIPLADAVAPQNAHAYVSELNAQRSYPDDHPRWHASPGYRHHRRVLEPSHVSTQSWLNEIYAEHDLNDDNLYTAIRWALNTVAKEQTA